MKKLKIIAELGKDTDQHALLVELPKEAIDGLHIATDGTVGTGDFITMLKAHYIDEPVDLMNLIYGPAVGDNNKRGL